MNPIDILIRCKSQGWSTLLTCSDEHTDKYAVAKSLRGLGFRARADKNSSHLVVVEVD